MAHPTETQQSELHRRGLLHVVGHSEGLHRLLAAVEGRGPEDRKSTRLNSSHQIISYAVFCLKKKKKSAIIMEKSFELARRPKRRGMWPAESHLSRSTRRNCFGPAIRKTLLSLTKRYHSTIVI